MRETVADAGASASSGAPLDSDERLMERGLVASRILLVRGIALRIVSIVTNIGLIALVAPAELGLLAVVRATFGALQLMSELGFELAMVRRRQEPTRQELSAHTGLRVVILSGFLIAAVAAAPVGTVGGLVPRELEPLMLLAVGTFILTATHSSCRIRLERRLEFGRLSFIEVNGLLLQNAGIVAFAAAGRFREGIFVVQAVGSLYVTVALWRASSLILPTFNLRPLITLWRDSVGFATTAALAAVRDWGTPFAIAKLFGLEVAGFWAFTIRISQQALLALEGYARAGMPVAGQLAASPGALRPFATRMMRESAAITLPLAALVCALLPIAGVLFPQWAAGIRTAQYYVAASCIVGVVHTAAWLVAVARRGSPATIGEHAAWLVAEAAVLAILYITGADDVMLAIIAGSAAGAGYLLFVAPAVDRPRLRFLLDLPLAVLAGSGLLLYLGHSMAWPPVATAVAASILPLVGLGGVLLRRLPAFARRRVPAREDRPVVSS